MSNASHYEAPLLFPPKPAIKVRRSARIRVGSERMEDIVIASYKPMLTARKMLNALEVRMA
jgi:hypothetical protein